ncbi:MAG: glycosyl transferase [Planctomycetota bacterium]
MDARLIGSAKSIATFDQRSPILPSPSIQLLRNERMVTMLSTAGSGYAHFDGLALTRWRPDATRDADGYFVFVRDLEDRSFWSTTRQPTQRIPEEYQVEFRAGVAQFVRVDSNVRTELRVFLATSDHVEFRQVQLTNLGASVRRLELTSYAELVLQDANADLGHLAYSKLFVETWRSDTGILYARRRPRESAAKSLAACHFLVGSQGGEAIEFSTCRATFLGRGNGTFNPNAMHSEDPLPGKLGSVLDPIFSLRSAITLQPGENATITFALSAGYEIDELAASADRFQSADAVADALAAAESAENPYHFSSDDLTGKDARLLLDSASSALYLTPRMHRTRSSSGAADQQSFTIDDKQTSQFLRHYRIDSAAGSRATTNEEVSGEVSDHDSYAKSLPSTIASVESARTDEFPVQQFTERLKLANNFGGFSEDGSEYVIRLKPDRNGALQLPPMPWANIISNEQIGFVTTETGAGYTWAGNSRLNRLTPWHNDPVSDPHGEAIFVRDAESGAFWSVSVGPISQSAEFEVRHGAGYSRVRHSSHGFDHEMVQFVTRDEPLKISCVRITNTGGRSRKLQLTSYHHWDLTDGNYADRSTIVSSVNRERSVLFAENKRRGVFAENFSFASLQMAQLTNGIEFTCDRLEFLGRYGDLASPQAIAGGRKLCGRVGGGFDQCAAISATVEVAPGESVEFAVLLGETESQSMALELVERFESPQSWASALDEVRTSWDERLSAVQIETPSPAIDLMVNRWLPYQNLSCRIWGRSSLYQSGGAYGYRDQLQDAAALVHHLPELTRRQILRHASHQFCEGDVMHWWHPPHDLGIRTTFADDLLWLPLFAAEYVESTGDTSLWDEEIAFLSAPSVPAGEAEILTTPSTSAQVGSLYEHCCRALDRGITSGRHGLPLMGCGDWNDGMNRVGISGTGESVWMAFFIDYVLGKMLPVCEHFLDRERSEKYHSYREQLHSSIRDAGWDGGWYRRAYFDDGTPLGTAAADECQIDALVQAWAVLSGADTPERSVKAMEAAANRLVDEEAGLIQLLDPPFDKMANDPGYIKGYLPGVRENGGQYTHGVLWFVRAMAELGQGSRAARLLEMISPVSHSTTAEQVATYQAEPYVIAADVYSQPPHAGRAGWSWYTGSAGWMWRVAVESILGVRLMGGNTLRVDPRISADWPECRVLYRLADQQTVYDIKIVNPHRRESGVRQCEIDGVETSVDGAAAVVLLTFDGAKHNVVVTI